MNYIHLLYYLQLFASLLMVAVGVLRLFLTNSGIYILLLGIFAIPTLLSY